MTARLGFRTLVATVVATLFTAVLVAAPAGADDSVYTLSGTVHLPDGVSANVMGGIQVFATGISSGDHHVAPDNDGNYSLAGLPADTYTVHFVSGVYYEPPYGYDTPSPVLGGYYNAQTDWGTPTPVDLTASDAAGIDFTFTKALHISGTVSLGANTNATWLGAVRAYAWGAHGNGTSAVDPNTGAYSIGGLAPGSYTVYFQAKPFNNGTSWVYPNLLSEYYNDAAVQDDATPVELTTGDTTGVDVSLERAHSISGHISLPDGAPSVWYQAITVYADGTSGSATAQPDAAGDYALYALAPGSYTVHFDVSYYYDPDSGDPTTPDLLSEYWDDSPYVDDSTLVVVGTDDVVSIDAALKGGHQFDAPPIPVITSAGLTVGSTLGVSPGSWSPGPSDFDYQWLRNGVPIDGATDGNYTIHDADRSTNITVILTGILDGYPNTPVTSAPLAIPPYHFALAPAPTISGSLKAGSTLTAKAGTWSPSAAFTYRWYRNSAAISGATHSTYKLTTTDRGAHITVKVTASKTNYVTTSKTSAAAYVPKVFSKTVTPTITGTAASGHTLTAHRGTWSPTATYSYRWYRNGVAIASATHSTYKLTSSDKGKKITVKVTGKRTGYSTVTKTSAAKTIAK